MTYKINYSPPKIQPLLLVFTLRADVVERGKREGGKKAYSHFNYFLIRLNFSPCFFPPFFPRGKPRNLIITGGKVGHFAHLPATAIYRHFPEDNRVSRKAAATGGRTRRESDGSPRQGAEPSRTARGPASRQSSYRQLIERKGEKSTRMHLR